MCARLLTMEDETRFAIVQWEDNLTSIISLQSIKYPRKPTTQYLEGEYVTAPFGRKLYKARISEISEDRTCLTKKATPDGQFPLMFMFEEEEMLENQDRQSTPTASGQFKADDNARKSKTLMPEKQTPTSTPVLQKSTHTETTTAGSSSSDVSAPKVQNATSPADDSAPQVQTGTSPADVSAPQVPTVTSPADVSAPKVQNATSPADVSAPQVQTGTSPAKVLAPRVQTVPSPAKSPGSAYSSKRKLENLEKDVKELRSSVKAMKKRLKELEEKSPTTSGSCSTSGSESDDSVLTLVSHLSGTSEKDINSIVRRLALKFFTHEELTKCTRTGKKTSKTGEVPKPPLDDSKLKTLERLVLTKCPSVTTDIFKKKFDNILKMERRAEGKK